MIVEKITNKLREEVRDMRNEVRDRTLGYIVTSLGLVAGLAWNEAIKAFIEHFFPPNETGSNLKAKFIYAFFITLIVVISSVYLARLSKKDKEEDKKDKDKKEEKGSKKK